MKKKEKDRVYVLVTELMKPITAHYKAGGSSPEQCFEVLHALAATTALVIDGTGEDPTALKCFNEAFQACLGASGGTPKIVKGPGAS